MLYFQGKQLHFQILLLLLLVVQKIVCSHMSKVFPPRVYPLFRRFWSSKKTERNQSCPLCKLGNMVVYTYTSNYCISSVIRQRFFIQKQSQKSRFILQDGSRSLGLFRNGKSRIIAKFHRTYLVICTHSRKRKTPSYG